MRLLDAWTLIHDGVAELADFPDEWSVPPYAILSHAWGEEEVLFHDIPLGPNHLVQPTAASLRYLRRRDESSKEVPARFREPHYKAGWTKVLNTCLQACQDGYEFVWIDTCCIDKSSSAELSEAINSMYRWYEKADVCYVFLADCDLCPGIFESSESLGSSDSSDDGSSPSLKDDSMNDCMRIQLRSSRWFTRGWTLQELLAPKVLHFFDKSWDHIAPRSSIISTLESITGIARDRLDGADNSFFSIAQRMSWASKRTTTRKEDEAYCLLGLFDTNLPLLYGEGSRAFLRLQEEIIKTSTDKSIFAWELHPYFAGQDGCLLFAQSPANFWWHARDIVRLIESQTDVVPEETDSRSDFHLTNRGLNLQARTEVWRDRAHHVVIAHLDCAIKTNNWYVAAIGLRLRSEVSETNSELVHPSQRMQTNVEHGLMSTLEEPMPSFRRLVYLPFNKNIVQMGNELPQRAFSISRNVKGMHRQDRSYSDSWRFTTSGRRAEVSLRLKKAQQDTSRWCIIAVHPRNDWHARDRSMMLTLSDRPSFGAIVIQNSAGLRATILLGVSPNTQRPTDSETFSSATFACWIFPGPPQSCDISFKAKDNTELFPGMPSWFVQQRPEYAMSMEYRFGLPQLCEQASSISHPDFTSDTARSTVRKFVILPDNRILRVEMRRAFDDYMLFGSRRVPSLEATFDVIADHPPAMAMPQSYLITAGAYSNQSLEDDQNKFRPTRLEYIVPEPRRTHLPMGNHGRYFKYTFE